MSNEDKSFGQIVNLRFFSYICNELVYLRFLVLDNTSCCHSIVLLCCSWYWGKSIIIIIIKERMNMANVFPPFKIDIAGAFCVPRALKDVRENIRTGR